MSTTNGVVPEYRLSKLQKVHTDAVRDMYLYSDVSGNPKLVTVSRDCDAKIFNIVDGTVLDRPELTFSDSVPMSSVTVMPQSGGMVPLLFFGCLNGAIFVHLDKETTPLNVLTFHSQNVCALRTEPTAKLLATGSWDNTAIVYDIAKENVRFKIYSHTHPVNDVAFLHPPAAQGRLCLLTASSDKSIILWDISSEDSNSFGGSPLQLRTFMGHEDCVRGVYLVPERDCFYSVSNDQTIKCWNVSTGYELQTLCGHLHFIYKIAPLGGGRFMTCGEDTTIRLWDEKQAREIQSITLPVVSIWGLIALNDTTLIAGCSDGRLYTLSTDPARQASSDTMVNYQQLIAKQNVIPYPEVVHLKLYEQFSLVSIPPSGPSEKRLIRMLEDDSVVLFEVDSERKGQWKPLGQVKEYIHQEELDKSGRVFFNGDYYDDVVPITLHGLKYRVAFNRNLDPWLVAADFVAFNHLESTDLQPVVKAIVTTVKYAPKRNAKDVFSDASEFPLSAMVLFDSPPNWDKFKAKFLEFHDALEDGALKLDPAKFAVVNAEFNDPGRNSQVFVDCYVKLFKWPNKSRFVVYDLFRLNLSNQYFASYCLHHLPNIQSAFDSILAATKEQDLALQLTALRCLVNLFSTVHGAEHMYRSFDHIQQSLVAWDGLMDNRNVHLAYSAIWFNYSVLLIDVRKQQNIGYLNGLMGVVADGDGKSKHSDAVVQMLNTFGNLLVAGGRSWRDLQLVRDYMKVVQSYPKTFDAAYDVKRAVQQINRL